MRTGASFSDAHFFLPGDLRVLTVLVLKVRGWSGSMHRWATGLSRGTDRHACLSAAEKYAVKDENGGSMRWVTRAANSVASQIALSHPRV